MKTVGTVVETLMETVGTVVETVEAVGTVTVTAEQNRWELLQKWSELIGPLMGKIIAPFTIPLINASLFVRGHHTRGRPLQH